MASKRKGGGQDVLEAGGGDVLLFNRGTTGPAGILVPAKALKGGTLGEGDQIWAAAMALVGKGQASTIAVKDLAAASANLTEITLLMPSAEKDSGPKGKGKGKPAKTAAPAKAPKKAGKAAKAGAKKKK